MMFVPTVKKSMEKTYLKKCKHKADKKMVKSLDAVPYKQRQWGHAAARNPVNAKQKLGLGLKQQKGTGFKPWEVAKYAAFTGPTGVTSKKFWTHPKKGTVMRLVKNPKTGKYENVYEEP